MGSDEKSSAVKRRMTNNGKKILSFLPMLGTVSLIALVVVAAILLNNRAGHKCLMRDNEYDINTCIEEVYDNDGKDAAVETYNEVINEAYNDGKYALFYNLLVNRATILLSKDGDCEAAVNSIEDSRVNELPVSNDKGVFYSEVIGLAITCNENEMEDYYKNKLMEVNNSGEIEEFSF